jgi:hypothetical protein
MISFAMAIKRVAATLHPSGVRVAEGTVYLTDCGADYFSCCALVLKRGLAGRNSAKLYPLVRKAVSFACYSSFRPLLEKNLPAVSDFGAARDGEFVYECDAAPTSSGSTRKANQLRRRALDLGLLAIMALAEELGFRVKMRIRT